MLAKRRRASRPAAIAASAEPSIHQRCQGRESRSQRSPRPRQPVLAAGSGPLTRCTSSCVGQLGGQRPVEGQTARLRITGTRDDDRLEPESRQVADEFHRPLSPRIADGWKVVRQHEHAARRHILDSDPRPGQKGMIGNSALRERRPPCIVWGHMAAPARNLHSGFLRSAERFPTEARTRGRRPRAVVRRAPRRRRPARRPPGSARAAGRRAADSSLRLPLAGRVRRRARRAPAAATATCR